MTSPREHKKHSFTSESRVTEREHSLNPKTKTKLTSHNNTYLNRLQILWKRETIVHKIKVINQNTQ